MWARNYNILRSAAFRNSICAQEFEGPRLQVLVVSFVSSQLSVQIVWSLITLRARAAPLAPGSPPTALSSSVSLCVVLVVTFCVFATIIFPCWNNVSLQELSPNDFYAFEARQPATMPYIATWPSRLELNVSKPKISTGRMGCGSKAAVCLSLLRHLLPQQLVFAFFSVEKLTIHNRTVLGFNGSTLFEQVLYLAMHIKPFW
jgi:hypothetical protein